MNDEMLLKFIKRNRIKTGFNPEIFKDKKIIITGGAGSIGSELARILKDVASVMVVDWSEYFTYKLEQELGNSVVYKVLNVADNRFFDIVREFRPDYIIHASAYKHVPLMQDNAYSCFKNNITTLDNSIRASMMVSAKLILISSDKAVNPNNVMGATKNFCEQMVRERHDNYSIVRFGNVMNSSGSVIPKFLEQIQNKQDLSVTGNDIKRYFMLISEACELVLMTATMGNCTYLLDMGKPIRIVELARNMIEYFNVKNKIKIVSKRKGDKLFEELTFNPKTMSKTKINKIFKVSENKPNIDTQNVINYILNDSRTDNDVINLLKKFYENIDNRS